MILCMHVTEANAQTISHPNGNAVPVSNSQQSQMDYQSATASQRAELFRALSSLNEKYTEISKRIPIVPLLKDPSKRFSDGEELIFSIIVSNLKLAELFGYKYADGMRLGLAEFTQSLDFQIAANEDFSEYSGWFIDESNNFVLELIQTSQNEENLLVAPDVVDNTRVLITVNGRQEELHQDHYQIESDDIYIDTQIMGRWFDIANASPFTALTVFVEVGDQLVNSSAGNDNGKFTLGTFKVREAGESADETAGAESVVTTLDGTASFSVGATLTAQGYKDYIDGVYSGSYTVKVSY